MKAYTKKGDSGCTYDLSGKRIAKDDLRIVCWGKIDELQAALDLAVLQARGKNKGMLNQVQKKLWQTSAELAKCAADCLTDPVNEKDIKDMEKFIDVLGEPPEKFVRMNTLESIVLNECRVRCRELERYLVKMLRKKSMRPVLYRYINRLSSLFFMLAYQKIKA